MQRYTILRKDSGSKTLCLFYPLFFMLTFECKGDIFDLPAQDNYAAKYGYETFLPGYACSNSIASCL